MSRKSSVSQKPNLFMKIFWNKVTWYSKLAAVILFFLVLLLGIYIGSEYQKIITASSFAPVAQRACPDEWIEDRMPTFDQNTGQRQYFIFNGIRKELADYDVEWIKQNCSVNTPSPVY